jgi:hypothetical protein
VGWAGMAYVASQPGARRTQASGPRTTLGTLAKIWFDKLPWGKLAVANVILVVRLGFCLHGSGVVVSVRWRRRR